MESFCPAWLPALAGTVLIDLVLAGDSAIVIAPAARMLAAGVRVAGHRAQGRKSRRAAAQP